MFELLCQANHTATDIKKYKVVQTGAKTQSGGVKDDLFNVEYHGSFDEIVAIPPIKDAKNVIRVKNTKDKILFFNINILYIILI